ncbi:MAG TPA: hypothetical protein H9814_07585 [Candidatus Bacteroides merdigallinarum]|uniref:Uncharacterized protein n=1 Tax=Candidatus Bacteroides merdigallinarum TaxID=2838473 RepID=A0A9D2J1D5_9BACE|nr:hypothetical protein [Candidatus Bacteroides merdigallinarum]
MMQRILKVVKCGECFTVKSEKAENGCLYKRHIVLQEPGGKYADQYAAALLGNDALCTFYEGNLVLANLRFQTREYNGQTFQDVTVTEIIKIEN